ncbi:MAG: hypothetical protein AB1894_14085 [Chloroflexota bacterium]
MSRARLILILWLVGLLFPLAWLGKYSAVYRQVFNAVFGFEWVHVLMHLALFAGFAILLILAFKLPVNRRALVFALAAILFFGVLQETLQFISQSGYSLQLLAFGGPVFDLGIDLTGGWLGWVALSRVQKNKIRIKSWYNPHR